MLAKAANLSHGRVTGNLGALEVVSGFHSAWNRSTPSLVSNIAEWEEIQ
jgi:hypothetical protein